MILSSSISSSEVSAPSALRAFLTSPNSSMNLLIERLRVTVSSIHCPTFAARDRTSVAPIIMKTEATSLLSGDTTRSPNPAVVDVQNT